MTAVILAAGRGTRMAAYGAEAKELLPLGDRTCLDRVLDEAFLVADDVIVVTSREKPSVAERSLDRGARVAYQSAPNGVVDALLAADPVGPIAVLLGDCAFPHERPVIGLVQTLTNSDGAVAFVPTDDAGTRTYGIGEVADGRIVRLREKPGPEATVSRLAVAGRYAVGSDLLAEVRARAATGLGADYPLTTLLGHLIDEGRPIAAVELRGPRGDVGTPEEYEAARGLPW